MNEKSQEMTPNYKHCEISEWYKVPNSGPLPILQALLPKKVQSTLILYKTGYLQGAPYGERFKLYYYSLHIYSPPGRADPKKNYKPDTACALRLFPCL